MGFLNRLSRRKKLLDFSIFLGYPKDAAVDILRSQADTHWSEPVRLWATYLAFVSFAGTQEKKDAAAYAASLSQMCRPGMLLVNVVPTVVQPFASVSGSFYSYQDSLRRIWVSQNALLVHEHFQVSVALFQWAFNSLSAISEPRVEILERVAWQLFRVLDGTEEMGRVGGSFRLAQSAGDTAYLRALESTEKAPALPEMWDPFRKPENRDDSR